LLESLRPGSQNSAGSSQSLGAPAAGAAAPAVAAALAELQCHICLETVVLPEALTCGHLFCSCCLARWLRRQASCPTCKAAVPGSGGIRLLAVEAAARALSDSIAPGVYDARCREARLALEFSELPRSQHGGLSAGIATYFWTPPPAPAPAECRGRLLSAVAALTPLRLREFRIATDVGPLRSSAWSNIGVDFELERIKTEADWEPTEWCWTAQVNAPVPRAHVGGSDPNLVHQAANSEHLVSETQGVTSRIELRFIVGSHNHVLDPGDDDKRFCLRLEAMADDENDSAGCLRWLLIQLTLRSGPEEIAALPFAVVLGETFPCAQTLQLAQSRAMAHGAVSSNDTFWRDNRQFVHSLVEETLVDKTARPEDFSAADANTNGNPASARKRRLEAVLSIRSVDYAVGELADHHADLFARGSSGEVDGFAAQCFPRGFVQMPRPLRSRGIPGGSLSPAVGSEPGA